MKVIAEIFSQGEEVVSGQIVDSNAAWLSQRLNEMGFSVKRHTAVGDHLDDLIALIREIAVRADCCICTGGLGPTIDDLTAEAAGVAAGQELCFDAEAMQHISAFFGNRQRIMPEINRKQAYFPKQAVRIDNPTGTAPGFALQIQRCWFVFLPGVPSEMKAMFEATVRGQLLERFKTEPDTLVTLRTIGIGESSVQQCLEGVAFPGRVQLGFRAAVDEVQTKLLFPPDFPASDRRRLVRQVADRIGDYVFAIDGVDGESGGDLLAVIDRLMSTEYSLATLETASGGLLAAKCQCRAWLKSATIAKNLAGAAGLFADRPDPFDCAQEPPVAGRNLLELQNDAVETARRLAAGLRRQQRTDLALVQLFQGSHDDYRRQDGSIVLYNGLKTDTGFYQSQHRLAGVAQTKQNQAALLSLDLLRRYLQHKCH